MAIVTVKLDTKTFIETERILETYNLDRNEYINKALEYYNLQQKKNEVRNKPVGSVDKDAISFLKELERIKNNIWQITSAAELLS